MATKTSKKTGFKQSYVANNIGFQASSSGRVGQTTANGRLSGARQVGGFKEGGRMVSRKEQYRGIRKAFGMAVG